MPLEVLKSPLPLPLLGNSTPKAFVLKTKRKFNALPPHSTHPFLSVNIFLLNAPFSISLLWTLLIEMPEGKGNFGQSNYTLRKLIVIENDDW